MTSIRMKPVALLGLLTASLLAQTPRRRSDEVPLTVPPAQQRRFVLGMQQRYTLSVPPQPGRVDFRNERVQVVRYELVPGRMAVPMHDELEAMLVCLVTECDVHLSGPDGKVQDVRMKPGETRWFPAGARSYSNPGKVAGGEILSMEVKK